MATFAEWHLVQFTADMRRREPRNVGVAVTVGEEWRLRLFAVDPKTHAVDGRALRRMQLTKDDYAAWVEYYTLMMGDGGVDRIRRSQRMRPAEFRMIVGGQTELHTDLDSFIENLFGEMVQADKTSHDDPSKELRRRVEKVLDIADISPAPDFVVPGKWGDAADAIPFNYGYQNGQLHLMDRLQLHQGSIERSKMIARDFNARANAAMEADSAHSFIAFYSQSAVDDVNDSSILAPLWRVGHIVDVDHIGEAAEELRAHIYG